MTIDNRVYQLGEVNYNKFLETKRIIVESSGFSIPKEQISSKLFPFQQDIILWALRKGKEIYHASDLQKQKKEAYRERKAKRKEAKERKIIKNLKRVVIDGVNSEGEPITDHDYMKEWALKELKRRGIIQEKAIKQQSIF